MEFVKRTREINRGVNEVAAKYGGVLTPELLIREAKPTTSPLHDVFVWDDHRAGHLYRIKQARDILKAYSFRRNAGPNDPPPNKFYLLQTEDEGPRKYVRSTEVFKDKELTRRAAIEAFNKFQASVKMLEPFPMYFQNLLDAIHLECHKVKLGEARSAAAQ